MRAKKALACLLAAFVLLSAGQAFALTGKRTSGFTAKTLDYLPEKARARTDTLVIGVQDLYGEINPFFAQTTGDSYAAGLMFDELVFSNNDGEMGDGVASVTEQLDVPEEIWLRVEGMDNTSMTYTFTIREGVSYLDGTPVTSDDFINALYLLLLPGYDGIYDVSGAGIRGVQEYLSGMAQTVSGIERVDERTFIVRLSGKNASALSMLAFPALRVSVAGDMMRPQDLQPEEYAAFYDQALQSARTVDIPAMAYGQYGLVSLEEGTRAQFVANTAYWRGAPKITNVELLVVEPGKELDAICSGDVDIISMLGSVEGVDAVWDYEEGFINLYTWEGGTVGYLGMDLSASSIFADARVRQALACGCDRQGVVDKTMERYGKANTMMLFDSFSVNADVLGERYPYDPSRAQSLLEEAGWVLGEDGVRVKDGKRLSFTFHYPSPNPVMDTGAELIAQSYEQLGMEVEVIPTPLDELITLVEQNECDLYFLARRLPQHAANAAQIFAGDSHLNLSDYSSSTLDWLMLWADGEGDAQRQGVMLEALFEQLYLELPVIPLYQRNEVLLVSARILNCIVTPAHEIISDVYRFMLTDTLSMQW